MSANPVASFGMAGRKTVNPKTAISVTLSKPNLAWLKEQSQSLRFNPSISQLIDDAVTEYRERQSADTAPKRPTKPK